MLMSSPTAKFSPRMLLAACRARVRAGQKSGWGARGLSKLPHASQQLISGAVPEHEHNPSVQVILGHGTIPISIHTPHSLLQYLDWNPIVKEPARDHHLGGCNSSRILVDQNIEECTDHIPQDCCIG